MKKLLLTGLFFVFALYSVNAGCCVIQDEECVYWDLDNWDKQESFCLWTGDIYNLTTEWENNTCGSASIVDYGCCDGWSGNCKTQVIMPSGGAGSGGGGSHHHSTTEANETCKESWTCEPWRECVNGKKTRYCYDNNKCGTETDKPHLSENCETQGSSEGNIVLNENNQVDELLDEPNRLTGFTVGDFYKNNTKEFYGILLGILLFLFLVIYFAFKNSYSK